MAEVVSQNPQLIWVPVDATAGAVTVYEGSIVTATTTGVAALGAAAGIGDVTGKNTFATYGVPLGVVVGTSRQTELYNSTAKRNSITSIITSNANFTVDMMGIEGEWGIDKQAYVQIAVITPETMIRMPIFDGSVGTAPTASTVTGGASATGMGFNTAAIDFTTIAGQSTAYCTKGLNMGIYRSLSSAHTTTHTVSSPFPYATAVGDKYLISNVRAFGTSLIQFDATASYVENDAAVSADYYFVNVTRLFLGESGKEYVEFRFNPYQFLPVDAGI